MKKEVVKTRIEVDQDTLQRLNIYKATRRFRSHNEAIKEMLDKCENSSK